MKVLVTGGCGYLGQNLVAHLLGNNHEVVVIDNLSRSSQHEISPSPRLQVYHEDLLQFDRIESILSDHSFDVVVHLAALAYVEESMNHPMDYFQNNCVATSNLLQILIRGVAPKMIFTSSMAVYGKSSSSALFEEDSSKNPINPYGLSKLLSELEIHNIARARAISAVVLRLPNLFGVDPNFKLIEQHEPETHLIPLVLAEAVRTKLGGDPNESTLNVFMHPEAENDGSCVRDYVHVSDVCSAIMSSINILNGTKSPIYRVFNIGTGQSYSVLQIIEMARQVTHQPIVFNKKTHRVGDPAYLVGDVSRALHNLDWKPKHNNFMQDLQELWQVILQEQSQ